MNHAKLALLSMILLILGGCSWQTPIEGKVIEGNLSFVFVVDQNDERLKSVGLEGVDVQAQADVGKVSGSVLATAKSSRNGSFSLSFADQAPLLKPIQFGATHAGYNPARESMNIPPSDKRLLIVLKKQVDSKPPPRR